MKEMVTLNKREQKRLMVLNQVEVGCMRGREAAQMEQKLMLLSAMLLFRMRRGLLEGELNEMKDIIIQCIADRKN